MKKIKYLFLFFLFAIVKVAISFCGMRGVTQSLDGCSVYGYLAVPFVCIDFLFWVSVFFIKSEKLIQKLMYISISLLLISFLIVKLF